MRTIITEEFIATLLQAPRKPGKRHGDSVLRGFTVRENKDSLSYVFTYVTNGKDKLDTIGLQSEMTVKEARRRAKEISQEIAKGNSPVDERREQRKAATLQELVDRYFSVRTPSRPNEVRAMFKHATDSIGADTKVRDIHFGDIEKLHRTLTQERGPVLANRVVSYLKSAFEMSLTPLAGENKAWRDALAGNPCHRVALNHEEPRGQLYSPAQLAAIGDAISSYKGTEEMKDAARLILFTGCRPIEAATATWSQFATEGLWMRPYLNSNKRHTARVSLSEPARQLVERLRANRDPKSDIVFPGGSKSGSISCFDNLWAYVRKQTGLTTADRLYDLRHSFGSLAAGSARTSSSAIVHEVKIRYSSRPSFRPLRHGGGASAHESNYHRNQEQDDCHREDDLRHFYGDDRNAAKAEDARDQCYDQKSKSPTKHERSSALTVLTA